MSSQTPLIERTFRERIILVGVAFAGTSMEEVEAHLDELALLVATAGADVVGRVVQRRAAPDPATFIGKGKAAELAELSRDLDSDTTVFDDELSPAQQRNLEKILGRTAIDRTAVILDIFGQKASTLEGKAQVELALLRYRLPRLRGKGTALSQQAGGGGIGSRTRGPGETQLEVDRRRLLRRMSRLETELKQLTATRRVQRKARGRGRLSTVSLVGYTNAGKSTLMRALTGNEALVANKLFATLDTTVRALQPETVPRILVSDTVGFIKNLPHGLVASFKSTLDEALEASLLLHVVDASDPGFERQLAVTEEVLDEIGAQDVPRLLVFNKIDHGGDEAALRAKHPGCIVMSAKRPGDIAKLRDAITSFFQRGLVEAELYLPWSAQNQRGQIFATCTVLEERTDDNGAFLRVRGEPAAVKRLQEQFTRR
jgi:GTPase